MPPLSRFHPARWPLALALLAAAACARPSPAPATQTPAPTIAPSPALPPTATPLPTPSPTPLPTPTPTPRPPIAPETASQIHPILRLGKGWIGELAFSPDGRLLAVASSIGVYLYETATLQEVRYLPTESWMWDAAFSPDGRLWPRGPWMAR
jgi:dipeptidyl aminopeptidase/acylaminoacyl peptidase